MYCLGACNITGSNSVLINRAEFSDTRQNETSEHSHDFNTLTHIQNIHNISKLPAVLQGDVRDTDQYPEKINTDY